MDYKILIADDEPEIRNLLRLYLENENYHVIEAEDGQRALDLLRAEQPALCILDIMMPKIDGYHVLQQIRKESNIPEQQQSHPMIRDMQFPLQFLMELMW